MFRRQPSRRAAPSPIPSLDELGKAAALSALTALAAQKVLSGLVLADCTLGNGHDSLFLAQCLEGLEGGDACPIIALDVQQAALDAASKRLGDAAGRAVRLLLRGHEHLEAVLSEHAPGRSLGLAVYNLGFLPGSGKEIVTRPHSTLASLAAAARLLTPGGLISAHVYAGHAGGFEEREALRPFFAALEPGLWQTAEYALCNKKRNPESLFLAHRM